MKAFHGGLKRDLCSALTHKEFVEIVMGVLPRDMGYVAVGDCYTFREEFRDEFWNDVFRLNPAQYDMYA